MYSLIRNDCRGFNKLSYTIQLHSNQERGRGGHRKFCVTRAKSNSIPVFHVRNFSRKPATDKCFVKLGTRLSRTASRILQCTFLCRNGGKCCTDVWYCGGHRLKYRGAKK